MKTVIAALALLSSSVRASTIWDGSFSYYNTSADFDKWSWSTEVGEYQWYIHGSGATSEYLNLDPSYKNPASTETHGLKLTIDNTAFWNGQTMQRTEIIPQTTANLGSGQTYYHFSLSPGAHYPDTTVEHQILFFESHFVQLKIGVAPTPTSLQFFAGSNAEWSTTFVAGTWYNFAYDINFSTGVVGLWFSTNSSPLTNVVSGISGTGASTNSEDFHVGVLAFGDSTEDWLISGVYIESGTLTTSVGTGSTGSGSTTTSKTTTTTTSSGTTSKATTTGTTTTKSTTTTTTTSSASGATQTKYGQCGGTGWTGATTCASGSTCTAVSAPYYYQCL